MLILLTVNLSFSSYFLYGYSPIEWIGVYYSIKCLDGDFLSYKLQMYIVYNILKIYGFLELANWICSDYNFWDPIWATDNIFAKYDSTKMQPEVVSFHEEQTTHELPNRIFTLAGVINSYSLG